MRADKDNLKKLPEKERTRKVPLDIRAKKSIRETVEDMDKKAKQNLGPRKHPGDVAGLTINNISWMTFLFPRHFPETKWGYIYINALFVRVPERKCGDKNFEYFQSLTYLTLGV